MSRFVFAVLRNQVIPSVSFCAFFFSSVIAFAQYDAKAPVFDVVSVRPSDPSVTAYSFRRVAPDGMSITGATVSELISLAYTLRDFQITNRPKWVDAERFDVSARDTAIDPGRLSDAQRAAEMVNNYSRLQSLLADRFQLRFHKATSEKRVLALIVEDGKRARSVPCSATVGYYLRPGDVRGAVSMRSLVAQLSHDLNRTVVDQTKLSGCYDMNLKWTIDPEVDSENSSEDPAISTALHTLGLKLISTKAPVEVLVIDHAERPSEN